MSTVVLPTMQTQPTVSKPSGQQPPGTQPTDQQPNKPTGPQPTDKQPTGVTSSLSPNNRRPTGIPSDPVINPMATSPNGASQCTHGEVRLQGTSRANEGRVEICINKEWATVCDDSWDVLDALVVCRQLGYSEEGNYRISQSFKVA